MSLSSFESYFLPCVFPLQVHSQTFWKTKLKNILLRQERGSIVTRESTKRGFSETGGPRGR